MALRIWQNPENCIAERVNLNIWKIKKIIFQEVGGSEEGMRTVTKESMCITHIQERLTEGGLEKGAFPLEVNGVSDDQRQKESHVSTTL